MNFVGSNTEKRDINKARWHHSRHHFCSFMLRLLLNACNTCLSLSLYKGVTALQFIYRLCITPEVI